MLSCDVAIIGGGPAGSTTGTLLKKYNPSLDVVILERERFPRDHVGESQLPAISQILDEMGVWDKVEAADFPIKIGGSYRWGSTDELWHLDFLRGDRFEDEPRPAKYLGQRQKTAFQVDRSIYDKVLLDHARSRGCRVFEQTKVAKVCTDGDRVLKLEVQRDSSAKDDENSVQARHYIDASGEVGILRRAFGVEVASPTALRNIAIWDYWQDAEWAVNIGNGGTRIWVMSLGWGWLWFIPVTPTRTSVGLVLPADYFKKSGKSKATIYEEAIAEEPEITRLLRNARAEGNIQATKDWNFLSGRLAGKNWLLTGDSCGFADPILSAGMTLAHTSGRKAAATILELDRGVLDAEWLKDQYSEGHRAQIKHHMQFADYWYSANGRFTDLREYCSDIARDAGLTLNAEDAFRWLATGGFALEEPGLARALSYGVSGIKVVSEHLNGTPICWELCKSNFWRLDLSGAKEDSFAQYMEGRIEVLKAFRRGEHLLPIAGVYAFVIDALKRNMDSIFILEDVVNALIKDSCAPEEAVSLALDALEALIVEGWIKTKLVSSRPCIKVRDLAGAVR